MNDRQRIERAVYHAVDDLNEQLTEAEVYLEKSLETPLLGDSGRLDSLGFLNLIVAVEDKFEDEFAYSISLTDERARSQKENPFRNLGTLIDYICTLVQEKTTP